MQYGILDKKSNILFGFGLLHSCTSRVFHISRGSEVFQLEFQLSLTCKGDNATDILIRGIIILLVTGTGDKLPSQGQPYCTFKRIVVQEIRLVQNVKFLQFAGFCKSVICVGVF